MSLFSLHPSLDALADLRDAQSDARAARARTSAHVARCLRCQSTLRTLGTIDAATRTLPAPPTRDGALAQILAARAAGERFVLPASELAPVRRTRWPLAIAAGVVLAVLALGVFSRKDDVEAGTTSGTLRVTPVSPRANEAIAVRYRPAAMLSGKTQLALRARLRSRNGESYNNGIPIATIATLTREASGDFVARVTLPDSVVYAALAVEDTSGAFVDTNGGRVWEVLVAGTDGRPLFDALDQRAHDMMGRNWTEGFATARRMVAMYPDELRGWSWLKSHQSWTGHEEDDTVRAMHRAALARFDARYSAQRDVPAHVLGEMTWYSYRLDSTVSERWRERLVREAPRDGFAIQFRLIDAFRQFYQTKDTTTALASYETLWHDAHEPMRRGQVASSGMRIAFARHDSALIRRWGDRLVEGSNDPAATRLDLAMDLVRDGVSRDAGMRDLRAALVALDSLRPTERGLTETVAKQRARHATTRRSVLASLGRALVASGQHAAGLDTLARASATGWSLEVFRAVRVASLAAGDSASALRMAARLAADPRTDSVAADSLRRATRAPDAAWRTQLATARADFVDRMLDDAPVRSLRGRVVLRDEQGREHDLRELAGGRPMVIAFWSRFCGPAIEAMPAFDPIAHRLERSGVRVVSVGEEPGPSDALTAFLRDKKITLPTYFDVRATASNAFNQWGTPSFYVIDASGRIRFDATNSPSEALARAEALRLSGERRTAAR